MLKQYSQQHNKIVHLDIVYSQHHVKKTLRFHQQQYNQQLNHQLPQITHKWIIKHIYQRLKNVHLTNQNVHTETISQSIFIFFLPMMVLASQ